jgi:hypothetical protein
MIFEPCPRGDCRGKLMVSDAADGADLARDLSAGLHARAYCPLCRQSFERAEGASGWQTARAQLA